MDQLLYSSLPSGVDERKRRNRFSSLSGPCPAQKSQGCCSFGTSLFCIQNLACLPWAGQFLTCSRVCFGLAHVQDKGCISSALETGKGKVLSAKLENPPFLSFPTLHSMACKRVEGVELSTWAELQSLWP